MRPIYVIFQYSIKKASENHHEKNKVSVYTATALVVGSMIGTGVFTSLGFQVAEIQSVFVLISIWIIGGIFALCRALSYVELSTSHPRQEENITSCVVDYTLPSDFSLGGFPLRLGFQLLPYYCYCFWGVFVNDISRIECYRTFRRCYLCFRSYLCSTL